MSMPASTSSGTLLPRCRGGSGRRSVAEVAELGIGGVRTASYTDVRAGESPTAATSTNSSSRSFGFSTMPTTCAGGAVDVDRVADRERQHRGDAVGHRRLAVGGGRRALANGRASGRCTGRRSPGRGSRRCVSCPGPRPCGVRSDRRVPNASTPAATHSSMSSAVTARRRGTVAWSASPNSASPAAGATL